MERRQFLAGFGAAAACPLAAIPHAARGQQTTMPVIGYLSAAPNSYSPSAFLKGLSEAGYIEGRNVRIEYRWAYNDNARWPRLVKELLRHRNISSEMR
jgi:putative ABC transport system substrate-binding protein